MMVTGRTDDQNAETYSYLFQMNILKCIQLLDL